MKCLKKLSVIMLIFVLVMSLTSVAFAASDNTITITSAKEGETYTAYKMLDLSVNDIMSAYSYKVNSAWSGFFTGEGAGAAYVDINEKGYVTWREDMKTAEKMEAFAKAAAAYAKAKTIAAAGTDTVAKGETDAVIGDLDSGHYLITSTYGTLAMVKTTPTNPNATINEKNIAPGIKKEVQEDSTNAWGASNSAQIGDTVNFKSTLTLQKGALKYVMHDKMDDGLTLNPDSITVVDLTKGTDYTVVTEGLTDGCTFEVRFTAEYLNTITAEKEVVVTYSAVLNEKAVVGTSELNTAQLTWGNNGSTEKVTTKTDTYKFEVLKYDAKDTSKANLAGAVFQLKDAVGNVVKLIKVSETEYRVANGDEANAVNSFVTVATGNIVITGVDLDEYTLVETQAPKGFNLLKDPVKVTVEETNDVVVEVANNSGLELPSTGGMGTTLIYGVGGILVIGAIIMLVTKRRMSSEK